MSVYKSEARGEEVEYPTAAMMSPRDISSSQQPMTAGESSYRQSIIDEFQSLTFRGIAPAGNAISLPLRDVFIDLTALADIPDEADTYSEEERRLLVDTRQRLRGDEREAQEEQELVLQLDSLRLQRWRTQHQRDHGSSPLRRELRSERLISGGVILGDPGAGKTTLLQFLALCAAANFKHDASASGFASSLLRRWDASQPPLPIFVPLAAYDDYLRRTGTEISLEDFLPVYYEKWRGQAGLRALFTQALARGRALILLDGLDEVLDRSTRTRVAEHVGNLVRRHQVAGNGWVVTSRIFGYREAPLAGEFAHFTLLELGPRQIERFAQKWCHEFEVWAHGGRHATAMRRAAEETQALLLDVQSNASVRALAASPLLLTMLAILRRQVGKLPDRRVDLYDRYIRTLIDNRETTRSPGARHLEPERFDPHTVLKYLMELSLWLQRNCPSGCALRADLEAALVEIALRQEGYEPAQANSPQRLRAEQTAERFLREMRHIAGLLAERGRGTFGFLHLTFQEFLAGRAMARMSAEERWLILGPVLHDPRWREPLLLCCGWLAIMEQRTEQVAALTRKILHAASRDEPLLYRNLLLAAGIAADDLSLPRALLEEIYGRLQELLDNPVPSLRRQAAVGIAQLARIGLEPACELLRGRMERMPPDPELIRGLSVLLPTTRGIALREPLLRLLRSVYSGNREILVLEDLDRALLQVAAPLVSIDDAIFWHILPLWAKQPRWYGHQDVHVAMRDALRERVRASPDLRRAVLDIACAAEPGADSFAGDSDPIREKRLHLSKTDAIILLTPLVCEDVEIRRGIEACLDDSDSDVRQQAFGALVPYFARDARLIAWVKAELDQESIGRELLAALAPLASIDKEIREKLILAADQQGYKGARAAAVDALGALAGTDDEVRDLLVRKLHDDEHVVTDAALRVLAPLASRDAKVRAAVGELVTMRWLFDEAAAEILVPQLGIHADVEELLLSLFKEQPDDTLPATLSSLSELSRFDPELCVVLLKYLQHGSGRVRSAAARALMPAVRNVDVRAALLKHLIAGDEATRVACVEALAGLVPEDNELRLTFHALLPDASEYLRKLVLNALEPHRVHMAWNQRPEELAPTEAIGAENDEAIRHQLLTDLRSDDPTRRRHAFSIGKLSWWLSPDTEQRAALLKLLQDQEPDLCRQALLYLIRSRNEEHAEIEPELRLAALAELRAPADTPTGLLDNVTELVRRPFGNAPWLSGTRSLTYQCALLLAPTALKDEEARDAIGYYLAQAGQEDLSSVLGKLGNHELMLELAAPIIARLKDPNSEVRLQACYSLYSLVADPTVCAALKGHLFDENSVVRIAAMRALAGAVQRDREIAEAVQVNLQHPDPEVQVEALSTIEAPSEMFRDVLQGVCAPLLQATDFSVRRSAVEFLAAHLPCVPGLLQHLLPWLGIAAEIGHRSGERSSWSTHQALADGLKALLDRHPESSNEIAAALSSQALHGRCIAATALVGQQGGPPPYLWPRLRAMLADGRDWERWPLRLMIAGRLIELHNEKFLSAAIESALASFDFGQQPWVHLPHTLPLIRKLAAGALGRLQSAPPRVRERLVAALHAETDSAARDDIYQALLRLSSVKEEAIEESPSAMFTSCHEETIVAHLSDLHFSDLMQAEIWQSQLVADLKEEFGLQSLDGLILSGDISNTASPEEFQAAVSFVDTLCARMRIPKAHLMIVPGNHDVSWKCTRSAYRSRQRTPGQKLRDGCYIDLGERIAIRTEKKYALRFAEFAAFHKRVIGADYPCEAESQWTLTRLDAARMVILGLNSAWQLDHHFRARISIHPQALSRAVDAIQEDPGLRGYRKIAVWHHPLQSAADDRITDHGFLERLSVAGFELALHGHIHKAESNQFRYDISPRRRRIDIVCAGTFGAPVREWVPGYPLQYNLLRFKQDTLTVETRRREEPGGAWKPDARWLTGPGADPASRYLIPLRS